MDQPLLFTDDVETWAEIQVAALRRLAARPDASNAVDWDNVIEEIEDLGSRDRHAVESLLATALAHLLKLWADPDSLSTRPWRVEVANLLRQARASVRPGMRGRIDLDAVWTRAVRLAEDALGAYDRTLPAPPAARCPWTFDELLGAPLDIDAALRALP